MFNSELVQVSLDYIPCFVFDRLGFAMAAALDMGEVDEIHTKEETVKGNLETHFVTSHLMVYSIAQTQPPIST